MQAQLHAISAAFGSAVQRQTDGLEDEGPLQARMDTVQAVSALAQGAPTTAVTAPASVQVAQTLTSSTPIPVRAEPVEASPNLTGMPAQLKAGMDKSDVRAHRNVDKPAQLNAQGGDIHLGPGQEQHLPHEAWHLVQQREERVRETMQMSRDRQVARTALPTTGTPTQRYVDYKHNATDFRRTDDDAFCVALNDPAVLYVKDTAAVPQPANFFVHAGNVVGWKLFRPRARLYPGPAYPDYDGPNDCGMYAAGLATARRSDRFGAAARGLMAASFMVARGRAKCYAAVRKR